MSNSQNITERSFLLYKKNELIDESEALVSYQSDEDSNQEYSSDDDRTDAGEEAEGENEDKEDITPMEALIAIANEGEKLLNDMWGAALVFPPAMDGFFNNMSQNRAPHLPCFDFNRVPLNSNGDKTVDYINASFVSGYNPQTKYIFCQAPFNASTTDTFWRMVNQQKPTIIIVLGAIDTKQAKKSEAGYDISHKNFQKAFCNEYGCRTLAEAEKAIHINQEFWPATTNEKRDYAAEGSIGVLNTGITEDSHLNIHNLSITEDRGKAQTTTLVHFKEWMEEEPLPEYLCDMRAAIKIHYIRSQKKPTAYTGPILLVCPTGIARCGIYALVDIVVTRLSEEHTVGIFETIIAIKQQRYGAFRSLQHYKAVREMIMRFAVSSGVVHETAIGEKQPSKRNKKKNKKGKNKKNKKNESVVKSMRRRGK